MSINIKLKRKMNIKTREKIAMGCYSGANVCLRGVKWGCNFVAGLVLIGTVISLVGDYQTKKIRKINSKR